MVMTYSDNDVHCNLTFIMLIDIGFNTLNIKVLNLILINMYTECVITLYYTISIISITHIVVYISLIEPTISINTAHVVSPK